MAKHQIRSESCMACPYRRDVPSGIWEADTYDQLPPYDRETFDQPFNAFACHATPEVICHGWAVVHSRRGREYELVSLRLEQFSLDDVPPEGVPLFSSGTEAAEHGKRDIENPSDAARQVVARLMEKYERLQ